MSPTHILIGFAILAAELFTLLRAILRPNREPAARLAWVIVILFIPIIGIFLYFLLGETRLSERRRFRGKTIEDGLPRPPGDREAMKRLGEGRHDAPFALARTINRLNPTGGNRAHLAADSDAAIDEMCADADAAQATVHGCFYIWLDDSNGLKVKDSFIRAAQRGVNVRVLADALGSYRLIRSGHWSDLRAAGVDARVALPVGSLLMTLVRGRIDLRNHRKSLIVDNRVAWVGSQNAADPAFAIKAAFAPWVDIMTRWEGPVAQHCQFLFVSDWMSEGGQDLTALLKAAPPARVGRAIAQVIGTGPTLRFDAMPNTFNELIHSARHELVLTTPYFVPDEQLLFALTSAARRGVRTIMVVPRRIDSRIVAATCKSYFGDLVEAGVELYRYRPGLLHAKTMIVDNSIGLIGSANLDRRSFELNFENNILFADEDFARTVRARQDSYIGESDRVSMADIQAFTLGDRIWNNFVAMMSPLL
ncbi:MAG: cardiolipin synthase [Sphingomicrobium sp.]